MGPNEGLTPSEGCYRFVMAKEACVLRAYDDGGGVWTIGWGHTQDVKRGDACTREQAEIWLLQDMSEMADKVLALVRAPLKQHQFDALCSFAFNCGTTALADSQLLRCVNGALWADAVCEMIRWGKDNGRFVNGLLARRAGEALMFSRAEYSAYS